MQQSRVSCPRKKILADVDDAFTDLQGMGKALRGELRIASSASFGRRYIAPFIEEFLHEHPGVSINLELSDTTFDIVQHGFDLAIRIGTLAPSALIARKIADNPRILVASPNYLKAHGTPTSPMDLMDHNCIVLNENRVWGLRDPAGKTSEIKVKGSFSTSYGEAVTEAAATHVGIALKSKWDVLNYVKDGTLVPVLSGYTVTPNWKIWAVRPPGRLAPTRVRIFTDFIEGKLRSALDE